MVSDTAESLPREFDASGWHYRFVRKLGQGGFGAVYEVEREKDGSPQRVAVKLLHGEPSGGARGRFRDELRLLLRLQHPAFPRVFDVATVDGAEAVVMELVAGRALDFAEGRRLPPRVVAEIGAQVAAALDEAWNFVPPGESEPLHVAHRDIKPGNLMVDRAGRVRVLDLGAASASGAYRDVSTRRDGGSPLTPNYCAPEVPRSMVEGGYNARVAGAPPEDMYALGATLVALATGAEYTSDWRHAPRFHQDAVAQLEGSALHSILGPALAMEPSERPAFDTLRSALRDAAPGLAGPALEAWVESGLATEAALAPGERLAAVTKVAAPIPVIAPAPRPTRGNALLLVLGAGALAAVVAALVVGSAVLGWSTRGLQADTEVPEVATEAPPEVAVLVPPEVAETEPLGGGEDAQAAAPKPAPEVKPAPKEVPPEPKAEVATPPVEESPPAEAAPTQPDAGGASIVVQARDGCSVSVDGKVASGTVAVSQGPHEIVCTWTTATADGAAQEVVKHARPVVPEGGSVTVECAPMLSRCGVRR